MLQSVLNQSLSNIEHILIDDSSADGSAQILDEYARKHPARRITVIHQPNAGTGAARNTGLDSAGGAYIAFLDSDDYYADNFLELLCNRAVAEKADICKGECVLCLDDGRQSPPTRENVTVSALRSRLGFVLYCWTAIYRRQLLADHGIRFAPLIMSQDTLFQNEAVLACGKLALCDEAHYFYQCDRAGSTSGPSGGYSSQKATAVIEAYQRIVANLNRRRQQCEPKGMAYVIVRLIIVLIDGIARNVRDPDDARRCEACARRMLRQCPVTAQSLVRKNLKNNVPQIAAQLRIR